MSTQLEDFILNITEINLYWYRLSSAVMKEYDLKGGYAIYFLRLNRSPEGLNAKQLTELCGKDKADVSRDVKALENRGLVTRTAIGNSIYRSVITLTDSGYEIAKRVSAISVDVVTDVGKNLSAHEKITFKKVLNSISVSLREICENGLD